MQIIVISVCYICLTMECQVKSSEISENVISYSTSDIQLGTLVFGQSASPSTTAYNYYMLQSNFMNI